MPEKCSTEKCERNSYSTCNGCKSNFCREHMFEHAILVQLDLNPIILDVNGMSDVLAKLETKDVLRTSYERLEAWRQRAHQIIDMYYADKVRALDQYLTDKIERSKKSLLEMKAQIETYIREKETTHEHINFLKFQAQYLKSDVDKLKDNDFEINITPLTFDKNLINFNELFQIPNVPPDYKTIERSDKSSTAIATDGHLLLLHQDTVLLLVDEELTVSKRVKWSHGPIYDMCFSSTLQKFIIINENEVFLLNRENMEIEKVRSIPWQEWFSCTCSETALYLSTKVYNSSLLQFNLLPSIKFCKRWSSPDICTNDEAIDGIVYNDQKLAIMISNDAEKVMRLELRSTTTLGLIWILPLNLIYNAQQAFRFCIINGNEWLVADHSYEGLIQVTVDGKMKGACSYKPAACCLVEFGRKVLAVSTKEAVYLHRIY